MSKRVMAEKDNCKLSDIQSGIANAA